jgi:hypothetical protein
MPHFGELFTYESVKTTKHKSKFVYYNCFIINDKMNVDEIILDVLEGSLTLYIDARAIGTYILNFKM